MPSYLKIEKPLYKTKIIYFDYQAKTYYMDSNYMGNIEIIKENGAEEECTNL